MFCFKSISGLSLISFFWNTMHQMLIPVITVRSLFTRSYFTNVALKSGCDSFRNKSTLCWQYSQSFLCIFNHFSITTKNMGLVSVKCFLYISYILFTLWVMGECQGGWNKLLLLEVKESKKTKCKSIDFHSYLMLLNYNSLFRNMHIVSILYSKLNTLIQ